MRNLTITILLLLSSFLSADECVDDATGAFAAFGQTCDSIILGFAMGCDQAFGGIPIGIECPLSCDNCPFDDTDADGNGVADVCDTGGATSHGCCLPDFNLHITESGKVYYNSSEELGGFQFKVQPVPCADNCSGDNQDDCWNENNNEYGNPDGLCDDTGQPYEGATVLGASGGDASIVSYVIAASSTTNIVLGYSATGSSIPAGCGTLVEVELDGIPTGLSAILITDPSGSNTYDFINYVPPVLGCTNPLACNYNADATEDDGSCTSTPDGFCDCAGTVQVPGYSCGGVPLEFVFNSSTLQAAYFFISVTLDGNAIASDDWVGAFNGDVCVGARQWNISLCGGGVCDVPIMGYDGNDWTTGYMQDGGIPLFKIFDTSENEYYLAEVSENIAWESMGLNLIDNLNVDFDWDNDGVLDSADSDPLNAFECSDDDSDTCDDCSSGSHDPSNDGLDNDEDDICDAGDDDDDNDGVDDGDDTAPFDNFICGDTDGDSCEDCSSGYSHPQGPGGTDDGGDGWDYDQDGDCDAGDDDDDNDDAMDEDDSDDNNEFVCHDIDGDSCDECASGTVQDPLDDGEDNDGDGACDAGDGDDDNDGAADDDDDDDNNAQVCNDSDGDSCDDCSQNDDDLTDGSDDPSNDGQDIDGDGICDAGDDDDDNDGVADDADADPLDNFVCSDTDSDTCEDCSSGTYDTDNDGADDDADGICDAADVCPGGDDYADDDGDGMPDACDVDIFLDGVDLISFYVMPEDISIESVFSVISDLNAGILCEGASAIYNSQVGGWLGSLTEIDPTGGCWVIIDGTAWLEVQGVPVDPMTIYNLQENTNLISYPFEGSAAIGETIPNDAQGSIDGIISEGSAALNFDGMWIGGLIELEGTEGYWVMTNEDVAFSFNPPVEGTARMVSLVRSVPMEFAFKQSTQQAFYFVNSATIGGEPIEKEDLIIAYNNDVRVGSRYWYGQTTDIPAMGTDEYGNTDRYCKSGDQISFKVLDASSNELIDMETDIETAWYDLSISIINLTEVLPDAFSLDRAYPNPFNPVTTLRFALPIETQVSIQIYNLQGREVISLINGNMEAGYHSVVWNADSHSSGVYFVKMVAGDYINTQKLMLVK